MRFSFKVFLASFLIDLAGVSLYLVIIKVIYGPFAATFTAFLISVGMLALVLLPCSLIASIRSRAINRALRERAEFLIVSQETLAAVDKAHYGLSWFAVGWQNLACFLAFAVGYSIFEGNPLIILSMRFWREYMAVLSVFMLMSAAQVIVLNMLMSKARASLGVKSILPGKRFGLGPRIVMAGMSLVLMVLANLMSIAQIGVSEIYVEKGFSMTRMGYRDLKGDSEKYQAALSMVEGMDAFLAKAKAYNDAVRADLIGKGPAGLPAGYLDGFIESVHWKNPLMAAIEGKSNDMVRKIFIYMAFAVPLSFLMLALLAWQLLRPFSAVGRSLQALLSGGRDGAKRDRLLITSLDEIGDVTNSFNKIIDRQNHELFELSRIAKDVEDSEASIGETVRKVDQVAQEIVSKAEVAYAASGRQREKVGGAGRDVAELVRSVGDVSRSASGQNDAIRSLSASIVDIQAGIDGVRDITLKTESLSEELVNASQAGATSLRTCFGMMGKLRQSSGQAAELVKAVGDIADRTNLLAMNASIEAAHSGAAGRGFSVIANGIRTLANDSHAQADSILEVMASMLAEIEEVVKLSGEAESSFRRVLEGISGTNVLTKEIAATMNEQASSAAAIRSSADSLVDRAKAMEALAVTQDAKARALEEFASAVVESSNDIYSASEAQIKSDADIGRTIASLKKAAETNRSAVRSLRALSQDYS